jgi:ATP-binding cassette subfamily C protein CydC
MSRQRADEGFRPLRRILGLWRPYFGWLAAGLIVAAAALFAGVGLMTVSGAMIGGAGAGMTLGLLVRALGVGRVALRYTDRLVTHGATFRALAGLRVWFFRQIARTSAGGLGFRRSGDVLGRLVADVDALDGLYLRIIVPLFGALLLLPGLAVIAGFESPALAVVLALLFAVAAFLLPWSAARSTRHAGGQLAAASGGLRIAALDALTGLREVRAFAAEGRMMAAVQAREATLLTAQRDVAWRVALAGAGAFLCAQAALWAVLLGSALGALGAGAILTAFLAVAAFEAVGGLPRAGALAGHATAAARRVLEAGDAPVPVPDPPLPARLPADFAIRFEGVHFAWSPDRPPVFDGLTIEIPACSRVALLGPSGAGKSSLAALLLKVVTPCQGRVTLGGTDIASLTAEEVRSRVAWLSQATHLFDDTIRANLLLARPDATDAALWAVLDAAQVGEMVRALPSGLDTWVGEGGARFSGGQGRRLALARALLSPAPVLLLDEPCAGLDAATERAFLERLNEVAEGRTVILIAHRLTGVERLDRIWRLSRGLAVAAAG